MNSIQRLPAALAVVALVWVGLVAGVSFIATPAKFLAPTLDLSTALDVGRHTFGVFAIVEIIMQGEMPQASALHAIYVAIEGFKLVLLGGLAWASSRRMLREPLADRR